MRQICNNFQCSVYVFGSSAFACPGCKQLGTTMTADQDQKFMLFFRTYG